MKSQRLVNVLLEDLLELEPQNRDAFLVEHCKNDPELRHQLEKMLELETEANAFLANPTGSKMPVLPDPEVRLGTCLGAYKLTNILGQGGMGTVYLGVRRDGEVQMQVAIKLMHSSFDSEDARQRFQQERQLLADLKHPHIATLHDVGTDEKGNAFLIMEWVQGQNLLDWYRTQRPSLADLLRLLVKVTDALAFANAIGVVHRDIKPDNIMVTASGEPKLLDFGIATVTGQHESGDQPMTPGYASPEQQNGEAVSPSTDVYALGLVLLQLLLDCPVQSFNHAPLDQIHCLLDCLYDSNELQMREALGHVLRQALAAQPQHRFADAAALNKALEVVLNGVRPVLNEPLYDLFVWYDPSDEVVVAKLVHELRRRTNLSLHVATSPAPDMLAHSRGCLVICGSQGEPIWQSQPEIRDALPFYQPFILPVCLTEIDGDERRDVLPWFLKTPSWLSLTEVSSEEDKLVLCRTIESLCYWQRASKRSTGKCPFRGLEAFREQDAHLFFGREWVSQQVLQRLRRHGCMAVLGPSGSGKSSVIRAGVLPHLRSQGFTIMHIKPGRKPLQELAQAFEDAFAWGGRFLAVLAGSNQALKDFLNAHDTALKDVRPCLVVDQAEELFTLVDDEHERQRTIEALCVLASWLADDGAFLVSLRVDFLGECAKYPAWNDLVTQHFLQLAPMTRSQLSRAIEMPARLSDLVLEQGLLERILDDVTDAAEALPLLEHALFELYQRRHGDLLTLAAYESIGGIDGALTCRAESEFHALDAPTQAALRRMFTRCLIHPGEEGRDTRRRALRDEVLAQAVQAKALEQALERWTKCRLLTAAGSDRGDLQTIELAHEALIHKWQRVHDWMAEDRQTAYLLARLRQQARQWQAAGKHRDYLPHGLQYMQFKAALTAGDERVGKLEQTYLQAGQRRSQQLLWTKRGLLGMALLIPIAFALTLMSHNARLADERDVSVKVTDYFISLFDAANPRRALGETITAKTILDQGRDQLSTRLQASHQREARQAVLQGLSVMYESLGIYDDSLFLALDHLDLARQNPNEIHDLVDALNLVSKSHYHNGNVQEGLVYAKEALRLAQAHRLKQDLLIDVHQRNGLLLAYAGKWDKALVHLETALILNRAAKDADPLEIANSLNNVGEVYRRQGLFAKAETHFRETLAIHQAELAPEDPLVALSLSQLGLVLVDLNQFEEAQALQERALAIRSKVLGPEHPETGNSLNNMGYLSWRLGKMQEAQGYFAKAYAVTLAALGAEHRQTMDTRNLFALVLKDLGEQDAALQHFEDNLGIQKRRLGEHPDTARTLNNLGHIREALGDLEGSYQYQLQGLNMQLKVLGEHHPETMVSVSNVGYTLRASGRNLEALPYYQQALKMSFEMLGEDHIETIVSYNNLGKLLLVLGLSHEAVARLQNGYDSARNLFGDDHKVTGILAGNLADAYQQQGEILFAAALQSDSQAIMHAILPQADWRLTAGESLQGAILYDLGDEALGLCLLEQAYAELVDAKGLEHKAARDAAQRLQRIKLQHVSDVAGL